MIFGDRDLALPHETDLIGKREKVVVDCDCYEGMNFRTSVEFGKTN